MDRKKGKFAMSVLEIKNLHVDIEGKKILKGVNLTLKTGEVAAIMGPNGTGKSTLSAAIMGNPNYEVTKGEILFDGVNILELEVDERARMGLFLAMQYPSEIPGITNAEFLRAASPSEEIFNQSVQSLHKAIDKASDKVKQKSNAEMSLVGQVDALIDMLYFTYGSFVLMGVDPERLFEIVHQANMGKLFPDGKAHFDPVTHKILKPDDWEKNYAPEPAIKKELERQIQAYQRNCEKNEE